MSLVDTLATALYWLIVVGAGLVWAVILARLGHDYVGRPLARWSGDHLWLDGTERAALDRHPTLNSAEAALTIRQPCGCVQRWGESPPNGSVCPEHLEDALLRGAHYSPSIPEEVKVAWRARDLHRETYKPLPAHRRP